MTGGTDATWCRDEKGEFYSREGGDRTREVPLRAKERSHWASPRYVSDLVELGLLRWIRWRFLKLNRKFSSELWNRERTDAGDGSCGRRVRAACAGARAGERRGRGHGVSPARREEAERSGRGDAD